jgi:hypothetical protein
MDTKPRLPSKLTAWYCALSDRRARLLAAVVFVVLLVGVGNYYLDFGLFGRFTNVLYA